MQASRKFYQLELLNLSKINWSLTTQPFHPHRSILLEKVQENLEENSFNSQICMPSASDVSSSTEDPCDERFPEIVLQESFHQPDLDAQRSRNRQRLKNLLIITERCLLLLIAERRKMFWFPWLLRFFSLRSSSIHKSIQTLARVARNLCQPEFCTSSYNFGVRSCST